MLKKKVLILTSFEGHISIAYAVQDALKTQYETSVQVADLDEKQAYILLYQYLPSLFKIPYKLAQYSIPREIVNKMITNKYADHINALIRKEKPDILICTYFLYNAICEQMAAELRIPFYNVLANPWTKHPMEYSALATKNLVFDDRTLQMAKEIGLQEAQLESVGWFVRNAFKPSSNVSALRKELGLDPNRLTLLVTGGSEGSTLILKVLPALLQTKKPLQMVFVSGNNSSLYKSLRGFAKLLSMSPKKKLVSMQVMKFTAQIHEYMQASDLVIGKAGPNTLFETVATQTPFFAIAHISGQEDQNLHIIREYKLGYVEENPVKAMRLLTSIMNRPGQLTKFAKPLELMAEYNRFAGKKLLRILQEKS